MNKRIMELATQATTYVDPSANDGVCWDFDKEKFAELIVFECIKLAVFKGDASTGKAIKEHFGVKE
jgi:hypothetical protein